MLHTRLVEDAGAILRVVSWRHDIFGGHLEIVEGEHVSEIREHAGSPVGCVEAGVGDAMIDFLVQDHRTTQLSESEPEGQARNEAKHADAEQTEGLHDRGGRCWV